MWEIWASSLLPKALKNAQSRPIWSHWSELRRWTWSESLFLRLWSWLSSSAASDGLRWCSCQFWLTLKPFVRNHLSDFPSQSVFTEMAESKLIDKKIPWRHHHHVTSKSRQMVVTWVATSVTRFGEILPFRQTFKSLRQLFNGVFSIWYF